MNPPFGLLTPRGLEFAKNRYVGASNDAYACFVERGVEWLLQDGRLGVLSSRLGFFLHGLQDWRECLVSSQSRLVTLADLGYGVLDDALVETAAYVVELGSTARDALCISVLDKRDKENRLKEMVRNTRDAVTTAGIYQAKPDDLRTLPGKVIAYWLPTTFIHALQRLPTAERSGISVYSGLQTDDDFRFLRLWWEVPTADMGTTSWKTFAKGGDYAPYADHYDLVVNWCGDGAQMKAFVGAKYDNWSRHVKNTDKYGIPGLTYTERTTSDISIRAFPEDAVFSVSGPVIQSEDRDKLMVFWAVATSRVGKALIEMEVGSGDTSRAGTAARHYRTGILKNIRMPRITDDELARIHDALATLYNANLSLRSNNETHRLFAGISSGVFIDPLEQAQELHRKETELFVTAAKAAKDVDRIVLKAFELTSDEARSISEPFPGDGATTSDDVAKPIWQFLAASDKERQRIAVRSGRAGRAATKHTYYFSRPLELAALTCNAGIDKVAKAFLEYTQSIVPPEDSWFPTVCSMLIGLLFGRWNFRSAEGESRDPWLRLPNRPPGCSRSPGTASALLCDDPGHASDWETQLRQLDEKGEITTGEVINGALASGRLRVFWAKRFFQEHIALYSSSRRKAPIYWQLATASGKYSAWLYYHRFTKDTFYKVLHEYVAPKVQHEVRKLEGLRVEGGADPTAVQRREIADQESFVDELNGFRNEVARVAPLWNPNLNDGVIINFAPLWRLVPHHRAWQKECQKVWKKLVVGKYDWAHLTMHLWPQRVIPKCAEDRSLAIAHGLANTFWYEDVDGKWYRRTVHPTEVQALISQRTSAAVQEGLKNLLEAPVPLMSRASRRSTARTTITRTRGALPRQDGAGSNRASGPRSPGPVDRDLLARVRSAIAANGAESSKSDVIGATGITSGQWNKVIKALLANGTVTQTGERRGARYHLAGADA